MARMMLTVVITLGAWLLLAGVPANAEPVYTRGDDNFDCRTMGARMCSDTGSGQGGRYWTPGYYNAYGQWERPL